MQELLTTLLATLQSLVLLLAAQGGLTPEISTQVQELQASNNIPAQHTLSQINHDNADAIVNIICLAGQGLSSGIASGVIISPTGLMLTNAHMAQYMLLEQGSDANIDCTIRTGAPAKAKYKAKVIYIPNSWVSKNAHQLARKEQYGTGELDYALLQITNTLDGTRLPNKFIHIRPSDTSPVNYINKNVLIRAYPAEFLGSAIALRNLYPTATVTPLLSLATFKSTTATDKTPDLLRLGGSIVAQGGSSGGAIIDSNGTLTGIIVTSTRSKTTSKRELSAISIEHINDTLQQDLHTNLAQLIALPGDMIQKIDADGMRESLQTLLENLPR